MKYRASLRYRVTFAFALLGMLISLALAISFYTITISIEKQLIAETLSTELQDYITHYQADPSIPLPDNTIIRTFVTTAEDTNTAKLIRDLKIGLHHIQFENKQYYAEVKFDNELRFIMLYDDKNIRYRENLLRIFLIIGVLSMTLLSALLGFWLAKRIISPVAELANRVKDLSPENYKIPLAKDFSNDEVGELARDFDTYLQRLSDFIQREQFFTSDVSHELRTPLTIIEGATDILLSDTKLDNTIKSPVERIARSVHDMSEFVSALLLLARENEDNVTDSNCEIADVIKKVIEGHQHLLKYKAIEIQADIKSKINLPFECTLLHIVLANLVQNAIFYTEQGQIIIELDEKGISIKDTGIGISEEKLQKIFDRYYSGSKQGEGIGLSLVKRICSKYHWEISIESEQGQGSIFKLSF